MATALFFLEATGSRPFYLADRSTGPDAGSTVPYKPVLEPAPAGAEDVESLARQAPLALRGQGQLLIRIFVDGFETAQYTVTLAASEPALPAEGDYWLDVSTKPQRLYRFTAGSWEVVRNPGRGGGWTEFEELHLPLYRRGRSAWLRVEVTELTATPLSISGWGVGVRGLKRRG